MNRKKVHSHDIELDLARALADLRERKGLSQEALGTQLGKGQSTIAKMESGKKRIAVVELLDWLKALDHSIEEFLPELNSLFQQLEPNKSLWNPEQDD